MKRTLNYVLPLLLYLAMAAALTVAHALLPRLNPLGLVVGGAVVLLVIQGGIERKRGAIAATVAFSRGFVFGMRTRSRNVPAALVAQRATLDLEDPGHLKSDAVMDATLDAEKDKAA